MPEAKSQTDIEIMQHILTIGADATIKRLERAAHGEHAPGTVLSRIVLDGKTARAFGLNQRPQSLGVDAMAWCLSIGKMAESKSFYYGWTIIEAFVAAWKELINGGQQ